MPSCLPARTRKCGCVAMLVAADVAHTRCLLCVLGLGGWEGGNSLMPTRLPASLAERRSCHGGRARASMSRACTETDLCAARRTPVDGLYSSAGKDAVGEYATEAIIEAKHAGTVKLV